MAGGQKLKPENDAYACLLTQLSGIGARPPKQLQAVQFWSKSRYTPPSSEADTAADPDACDVSPDDGAEPLSNFDVLVRDVFEAQWAESGKGPKEKTAFRAKVTRDIFEKLPAQERKRVAAATKTEHNVAVKAWTENMNGEPSTDPKDRQQ